MIQLSNMQILLLLIAILLTLYVNNKQPAKKSPYQVRPKQCHRDYTYGGEMMYEEEPHQELVTTTTYTWLDIAIVILLLLLVVITEFQVVPLLKQMIELQDDMKKSIPGMISQAAVRGAMGGIGGAALSSLV
jgi:hypothetical protein